MKKSNEKEKEVVNSEKEILHVNNEDRELEEFLPHLMEEISNKKKALKINSVNYEIEQTDNKSPQIDISPEELINPGVIDFIRRCTTKKDAFEILDYCLKRKELTLEEYNKYKNQISLEGGLKKLIDECGGIKNPGYYERKYYKKDFNLQKFKGNKYS